MGDLHFPKSCTREGWEKYPLQEPLEEHKKTNIVNKAAQNDCDGSYTNDKRGIAFGVVGHVTEEWVDEYLYSKDGLFNSDKKRYGKSSRKRSKRARRNN
jgi:hypothetical protein